MKTIKSILSIMLCLALVLSFAGCHKKGEIAVKFGDVEFTSAMYSMALLNADSEARSIVDEAKAAEKTESEDANSTSIAEQTDYLKEQVEGVAFEEWVKTKALEELSKMAAYRILCKENEVELTEDVIAQIDSYVNYYYPNYEAMLTANGIGKNTYREMELGYAYSDAYFEFLYGEEGSKAVPEADMKAVYDESYRTVFMLYSDLSQLKTDDEKAKEKERLDGFKARLDKGESIVDIYNEFNSLTGDNAVKEEKDVISIIADAEVDSNYGFEDFETVKALSVGATTAFDQAEHEGHDHQTSYYFVIKVIDTTDMVVDTENNTTFFDAVKGSIRWNLKQEEYEADIATYAATLTPVINKNAIKPFKVENIKY